MTRTQYRTPVVTKISEKAVSAYQTVIRGAIDIARRGSGLASCTILRSLFENVANPSDGMDELAIKRIIDL